MAVRFKKLYQYLGIKIQDKSITSTSVSIWNEGKYGKSPWKQKTLEIQSVAMIASELNFPTLSNYIWQKISDQNKMELAGKRGLLLRLRNANTQAQNSRKKQSSSCETIFAVISWPHVVNKNIVKNLVSFSLR